MTYDFQRAYRTLKRALEVAYTDYELGPEADDVYEEIQRQLLSARRLEEVGDVIGAQSVLRDVAKALPNVKLKVS